MTVILCGMHLGNLIVQVNLIAQAVGLFSFQGTLYLRLIIKKVQYNQLYGTAVQE